MMLIAEEQRPSGAFFPVADLRADLEKTPFGFLCQTAGIFVDYIVIAATASTEPSVQTVHGGNTVLMKYEKVVPMFGAESVCVGRGDRYPDMS